MCSYATVEPDITELWHRKVDELSPMVMRIARGDMDMFQDGILGIRDGLLRAPDANRSFLLQAAKFGMLNSRAVGRSIDTGSNRPTRSVLADGTERWYQKNMARISIDLMSDWNLEYPESSYDPEVRAIDKVCAGQFYSLLDRDEAAWVDASIKCLDGRNHDSRVMKQMGIGKPRYARLRRATRHKFIRGFGTDEEVARVEQYQAMEDDYR